MIDEIYSIHHLTHSIDESPNSLKIIFNSCLAFFGGSINIYKIKDKNDHFVIISNIKKDKLTDEDKIEFIRTISNYKNDNSNDIIEKW